MRAEPDWDAIARASLAHGGPSLDPTRVAPVGGGCINASFRVGTSEGQCFVKLNRVELIDMFDAEAEGLRALADAHAVRVPAPLVCACAGPAAFLVLEWIELGRGGADAARRMGASLAALHRVTGPRFGWHRDNTLGSTPQPNAWSDDWIAFLRERRIGFQLELAARNGHRGRLQASGSQLLECLPAFFGDYRPAASLLHGDLWGGNWQADTHGAPVIFDPAVHYGDRESEIAMTELFGGFGADFHDAYRAAWPLDPGYAVRRDLYQLYHVLNHLNLFGTGYLAQAQTLIDRLLTKV